MNGSNNASNSRTGDQFARSRFRSVTKDERLQPKPATRALDFSRLRFKSVYRKNSSTDQTESTLGDPVLTGPQTETFRTESIQSIHTGSIQSETFPFEPSETKYLQAGSVQTKPLQTKPPPTEPLQTEPSQTDSSQTDHTRTKPRPNGLVNLCLSLRSASDNPFFSGIEAMPDIRPRKKSIPLVSELVLKVCSDWKSPIGIESLSWSY